ncbi:MAG: elongation factor 4 [Candidatus Westeberhardia cardiocondylae]|nr:elongation factor 4 [Candidatus Westeberhardia cardiocondylae]
MIIKNIRNFSIIAHIDHGKSTLADRFIQICGGLNKRDMVDQVLDSMELEKEKGITIKAQNVSLNYKSRSNEFYQLNFIDTPGHVDFSHEVSRSLFACEGILLLIDVSKGIESQTLSNYYFAIKMKLKTVVVLNKVDLCVDNINPVIEQIENVIGISSSDIVKCSAKTGFGVIDVLERLIHDIPCPIGNINLPLQALIIDSWFDNYLGVTLLVCVKNGILKKNDKIKMMSNGLSYFVTKLGIFTPKRCYKEVLISGEIGWVVCSIKDIDSVRVGDTITLEKNPAVCFLPSFKKINPQVYAGIFPLHSNSYEKFCRAIKELSLNDSSFCFNVEHSVTLGYGFRCGFLGLLHMEIIKERLKREYGFELIVTSPTVSYEIVMKNHHIVYVNNPCEISLINGIIEFREPFVECCISFSFHKYIGKIIELCISKRGIQIDIIYKKNRIELIYHIPMVEVISKFFDELQIISNGYASVNYEFKYFKKSNLKYVNILICGKKIDVLGFVVPYNKAFSFGSKYINKLKSLIPRQQFDVVIQAAIGKRIIARSNIQQLRKNVTEKCYGGDVSRKKKLLEKQKRGKKAMKKLGHLSLSKEIFLRLMDIKV